MSADNAAMSEEDRMAAEWAAALDESKPAGHEVASEVTTARRERGAGHASPTSRPLRAAPAAPATTST